MFIAGAVALLTQSPPEETVDGVLDRSSELLTGYLADDEFLDLLRVIQIALLQGQVAPEAVDDLRAQLSEEYPASDPRMNRELVRLLVYLQDPAFVRADWSSNSTSDVPSVEKMQIADACSVLARRLDRAAQAGVAQSLRRCPNAGQGGHSFAGYIENVSRDFFATFNEEERQLVLADGAKWPTSALVACWPSCPNTPAPRPWPKFNSSTGRSRNSTASRPSACGSASAPCSGASGDAEAMAYLRELFESEPDRRVPIAMGLAQQPDGENWPILVPRVADRRRLGGARSVDSAGASRSSVPKSPEAFRQVILRGLMLRENGGRRAVELLEKWTGTQLSAAGRTWDKALAAWQAWFVEKYPDLPEPTLPVDAEQNHWTYQELLSFLTGPQASQGVAARGAVLFEKAQCVKCHRYGDRGDTDRSRLDQHQQAIPEEGNPGVDPVPVARHLRPIRQPDDRYRGRQELCRHGVAAGDGSLIVLQAERRKGDHSRADQ